MRPQNIAQRRMHQVCAGMIAHHTRTPFGIGNHRHAISHVQCFFRRNPMRHQSGHWIISARDFRQHLRFGAVVKRSGIGNLPARLSVNRRTVQHHFAGFAGF